MNRSWLGTAWRTVLPPVVFGVLLIAAWQAFVVGAQIKPFLLPAPSAIWQMITHNPALIWHASLVTGGNALVGLVAGTVVALVLAAIAAAVRVFDHLSAPIVAAIAVLPIVAVAPVLYTMFGAGSQLPRQIVAGIAAFAPVFLNTLRGLRQVKPVHRELMTAYAASPWQATRAVTLPGALPYLFSGINVAASLAVISALVAEYFGGPQTGLGSLITSAAANSGYAAAWAYVFGAIVVGLVFYLVTLGLEKAVTRGRGT
ncbi:ABC transporter permease [Gryllotalpicola protaetiae]|uniref:ABC transporter permease subunit n=1 Tax=Gryllotalpicola protaetiae TaxID=2419771 RepID=A0A387BGY8_9MICO|nr:ABC transporter permease subunit [Gryllotalpicola protaetiae]AYG03275.1 ABC transporter permease subunit [Gryllotalpicola protaetiae]